MGGKSTLITKIIAERDRLNKDLELEHSYITQLNMDIKNLEESARK